MLYLIGGLGRTGKTTLARRLIEARPMALTSTDVLQSTFAHTAPDLGIEHQPDGDRAVRNFRPHFMWLAKVQEYYYDESAMEGHVIRPHIVAELRGDKDFEGRVSACFLGWSSVDHELMLANDGRNDWLSRLPKDQQGPILDSIAVDSAAIEAECRKHDLPYIDLADGGFHAQQDRALKVLLSAGDGCR